MKISGSSVVKAAVRGAVVGTFAALLGASALVGLESVETGSGAPLVAQAADPGVSEGPLVAQISTPLGR